MTPSLIAPSAVKADLPVIARPATAALPYSTQLSRGSLAGVVLAHAGLLVALLFVARTPEPVIPPHPITVSLIEPEAIEPDPQPKPKPQPRVKPLPPPPVLSAKRPLSAPQPVVEPPEPDPTPVAEVAPPPAPVVTEVPKPAPAPPAPTPPRPADYLNNPKPRYPALSRRLGEEGVVRLNILVNPDGSVARLEIMKSSGYVRLDESARKTVQENWKFVPARQAGKPVAAWVIVPIQFTLRS